MAVGRAKKALKWVGVVKTGARALLGKDLSRAVSDRAVDMATPSAYARGGVVQKTGNATVHKGELILTKAVTNKLKAFMEAAVSTGAKKKKPRKRKAA